MRSDKHCGKNAFCDECAEKWQKMGFESEAVYLKYLENRKKYRENLSKKGREEWQKEQARSSRLQALIDKAFKTLNEDDYMEEQRLKSRESIRVERD